MMSKIFTVIFVVYLAVTIKDTFARPKGRTKGDAAESDTKKGNGGGGGSVTIKNGVSVCSGQKLSATLTGTSGTLKSNGGGGYDGKKDCKWLIQVAAGKTIHLTSTSFNLYDKNCKDKVEIFDSEKKDKSAKMGKFCGTDSIDLTSTGNVMFVTFKADKKTDGGPGFELRFVIPGETPPTTPGPTPPPATPAPTAPPTPPAPTTPPTTTTVGPSPDGNVVVPEGAGCSGTVFSAEGTTGTLYSPGFSNNRYPRDADCKWLMTVPIGKAVNINVEILDIKNPKDNGCDGDHVSIYRGQSVSPGERMHRFCGSADIPAIKMPGRQALIVFESDGSTGTSDRRFKINFSSRDVCAANEFTCGSGDCIPESQKCDGVNQCPDNSDEHALVCQDCGMPPIDNTRQMSGIRIIGGEEAVAHGWPWMISLYGNFECGASLIAPQWVSTAAHCCEGTSPSDWTVYVGQHRFFDGTEMQVEQMFRHPHYDDRSTDHDICLMKLTSSVTYGDNVRPVCLPAPSTNFYDDQLCYATGWGDTSTSNGYQGAWNLMEVDVPLLTPDTCATDSEYGPDLVSGNMICAGYVEGGGKDACQGDSGGPLQCKIGNKWTLAGITSWGYGCALSGRPGVYARVKNYVPWIQETVFNN